MILRPKNKKIIIIALALVILGVLVMLVRGNEDAWIKDSGGNWIMHGNPKVKDFESCAKIYPVIETYPEQCRIPNGPSFTKQY